MQGIRSAVKKFDVSVADESYAIAEQLRGTFFSTLENKEAPVIL